MYNFFSFSEIEYILRFIIAAFCGGLIGLEREKRAKNAGIRTHVLVAISATLMMVVSKYGFFDVIVYDGIDVDASRIAASVVSAIGFLGVGVIFVRKENTVGLTTAAGLWATVGMGITIGAGLYVTGIAFTLFIIFFQLLLHNKNIHLNVQTIGTVSVILDDTERTTSSLEKSIKKEGLIVKNMYIEKTDDGNLVLTAKIVFGKDVPLAVMIEKLGKIGELKSIDINSVI